MCMKRETILIQTCVFLLSNKVIVVGKRFESIRETGYPTVVFRESFQFVLMSINIPEHIHKRLDVLLFSCVSLSFASKGNVFVLQKTQNIIVQLIFFVVYHAPCVQAVKAKTHCASLLFLVSDSAGSLHKHKTKTTKNLRIQTTNLGIVVAMSRGNRWSTITGLDWWTGLKITYMLANENSPVGL